MKMQVALQYFSEDLLFFHTFPLLWLFTYDESLLILRRGFLPPSPRPEQHSPSALSVPQRTLRLTPRTRLHALRAHLSHPHRAGDPVRFPALIGSNYKSIETHFNVPSMCLQCAFNVFSMGFLQIENRAHWGHIAEGGEVPNVL